MRVVTKCCLKETGLKFETEYPLGGRVWSIETSVPVCEGCGDERPETVEVCDNCGEPADNRGFKKVNGDDWCAVCIENELDRLIEHLKAETGLAG